MSLPVGPLANLTAITAYDADGNPDDLSLDGILWDATAIPPQRFLPAGFATGVMLRPRQGIEIDFVAGYGSDPEDVPATLRQALLLLVAYWYEYRGAVIVAGTGAIVPTGFDQLVAPYRRVRL